VASGAKGPDIYCREPAWRASNIAAAAVAHAPADGYTLLLDGSANAINQTLYRNLDFDFLRDIAPVAGLASISNVMEVNPSFPAKTVAEFIALRQIQTWARSIFASSRCWNDVSCLWRAIQDDG